MKSHLQISTVGRAQAKRGKKFETRIFRSLTTAVLEERISGQMDR